MYLEHISLTNFRNYSSLELGLAPGPVVLCGGNAQGKSNLLEAIYLLATTKSHRTTVDRDLVHWDAGDGPLSVARLVAEVCREGDRIRVEIALGWETQTAGAGAGDGAGQPTPSPPRLRKQAKINGVPRRASEVLGQLNVVIFSSQDVEIIGGSPAQRRRYLDITNSQADRAYLRALQRYTRVLSQRNHLLRLIREGSAQTEELGFWNEQLVEEGCYILRQRRSMISELAGLAGTIYSELSGGSEALDIAYLPNPPQANAVEGEGPEALKEAFHQRLTANLQREVAQGATVTGPHRDDLQFTVNARDMGLYGSRGQQRTIAAALKLAEVNFLVSSTGEEPVLLLDDILSELDAPRRRQVLECAMSNVQTLLTTTDLDRIDADFLSRASVYSVQQGEVRPVGNPNSVQEVP
ncbi:MAG: DNA replication/repair protein RecF [Dehalococcoidia bacterium]